MSKPTPKQSHPRTSSKSFVIGKIRGSRNDLYKVSHLRDFCRLRYSQLMGSPCINDHSTEGSSSGTSAVEHQTETEFCEMNHVYYQFTLNKPEFTPEGYREMADLLVRALYAYHQYAGLRPMFDYPFKWPPESCLNEIVLDKASLITRLRKAAEQARQYLVDRGDDDVDHLFVRSYTDPKLKGTYDWVDAEPII